MAEAISPFLSRGFVAMFEYGKWNIKKIQRQSEINLLEYIINIVHQLSVVYGGSSAEGTDIKGSDEDHMLTVPGMHVVCEACEERELTGHVFLMREDGHRPCYPSLQLLSKDDNDHILIASLGGIEKILKEGEDGTQYLSSYAFARWIKEIENYDQVPRILKIYQHGPCTTQVVNVVSTKIHEYDNVYTIPCKTWPTEANEWIKRPRLKGWPTPEVIQKVVHTACTLVPLGNPSSEDQDIEWRISFLLGERELMWSLNNCQYYVFITLKYILKMHLDKLFPDTISTFHMKTILFWISEEQGLEYWRKEKFFQCIRDCLDRLLHYITETSMPHYFVRGNNILTGKLDSAVKRNKLSKEVRSVISNVVEVVSCCFENGGMYTGYNFPYYAKHVLRSPLDVILRRFTLPQLNELRQGMENLPISITEEHKSLASDMLDALVGVHLQKTLNYFSAIGSDFRDIETLLLKGCKTDAMAGMLQLATFYYMCREMDMTKDAIKKANTRKGTLAYIGRCSKIIEIKTDVDRSFQSETMACDVIYSPSDLVCLPTPLQYECALFDNVRSYDLQIHPVVYSEALSVLVHIAQGENQNALAAVENLAIAVKNNKWEFYDIALNLLGYCYSLVGEQDQALRCFCQSYQERRSNENPCLYHAIILLLNKARDEEIVC
ncbi:hypothetical protein ACJMK2_033247 [Sinanodonta woodiana]|uniref:Mab-21-like HhH/H2TH-like domain-containing protein n=1 Tax=Sinanodonta woodiana TaxID=1069815 RepID=A0ABD3X469_SINWO